MEFNGKDSGNIPQVSGESTIEGTAEVVIKDDFKTSDSKKEYFIKTDSGYLKLNGVDEDLDIKNGSKIRVNGKKSEGSFDLQKNGDSEINVLNQAPPSSAIGKKKMFLIAVNFSTTAETFPSRTDSYRVLQGVASFYKQNSFNKFTLDLTSRNIFGFYKLSIEPTCDLRTITDSALAAADRYIPYTRYQGAVLVLVFPDSASCGISGIAMRGPADFTTGDGVVSLRVVGVINSYFDVGTVSHEIAHTFYAEHSNGYDCGNKAIRTFPNSSCTSIKYLDEWDSLGHRKPYHFNAYHKEFMGWGPNIQTVSVPSSASYTIYGIESVPTRLQALRIPLDSSNYIYVEKRSKIGLDISLPDNVTNSVLLHVHPKLLNTGDSNLIDTTPRSDPVSNYNDFLDSPLKPGSTITYTKSDGKRITITLQSADSKKALVWVTL